MKKYIIILLLTMISIKSFSQRMVYKQKALEVNSGILNGKDIGHNYYFNITLNKFGRYGNYWIWGVEYQRRTADYRKWRIPLESYLGEMGYSKQLLSDRRKFITVNLGLTAVAGYELVNKGDSLLLDGAKLRDRNQIIFGAGGRLSIETYLSDRIVLLLQGRIKVLWGSDLERFRPSVGAGLRFNF